MSRSAEMAWVQGILLAVLLVPLPVPRADAPPAEPVVGNLEAIGSDTLSGLMQRWGELLAEHYPGIRFQLQSSGSASAPAALIAGTTRLGPMSRRMMWDERRAFIERYGYPPMELEVGRDALAVVVHRHNPLESLSRAELDGIFSDSRRCGGDAITHWNQLDEAFPAEHIELHGRNVASGTHDHFMRIALCGGDFRPRLNEHAGSAAVVAAVAAAPAAIGYAGLNHLTASVRTVAWRDDAGHLHHPTAEAVLNDDYPLSRGLYLYVHLPPGQRLPGPEWVFLELVLSPEGQDIVEELGFVRLPERRRLSQGRWLERVNRAP